MIITLLLTLIWTKAKSQALDSIGTLWPVGGLPLYNSYTSTSEISDYTFLFQPDHTIPSGGQLYVTFPDQFSLGLGVSSPICNLGTCSIFKRTVTIIVNSYITAGISNALIIYGVKNPSQVGGTGNFQLESWNGNNLLDMNQVFGVIGISGNFDQIISGTASIQSGGSSNAGDITRYDFTFKLSSVLGAWDWLRFTFPDDGYDLAKFPSCLSVDMEGNSISGVFSCISFGNQVTVTGIDQNLAASTEYAMRIAAKNPPQSGLTGTFTIESGRNYTNIVYERITGLTGVTILPGRITEITLKPNNTNWSLTKNKVILYNLQFLLRNPIEQGGTILIICSTDFNMDGLSIQQVLYGLDDISSSNTVTLSYSTTTKILTLSNFAAFTPKLISIIFQLTNPSTAGSTVPLIIRTMKADGRTVIDENSDDAYVTILDYSSPTGVSVSYPGATTNQATGANTQIQIDMFPQVEIPQLGWITINIPYGFVIPTASPTCQVKPTNMPLQAANACTYKDGVVTLQLYPDSGTTITGKFLATVDSYILITTITAPYASGDYIFDFNTYSEVWTFLESGSGTATMAASTLTPLSSNVVHAGIDTETIMSLQFTTQKYIPSGQTPYATVDMQGLIEIQFPSMSGGNNLFRTNLGLGISQGGNVPCKVFSGLTPARSGVDIQCLLTVLPSSASASTPAIVTISEFAEVQPGTSIIVHFAGLLYVQTANAPTIVVTTYQNNNRIRYNLETGSVTLTAGNTAPASNSISVTYTNSNSTVNATNSLTINSFTTTSATGATSPYILLRFNPTHDKGYCYYSAGITCQVGGTSYSCVCYPKIDMVLIYLSASLAAGTRSIVISGLVNPDSVSTSSDAIYAYTIGSSAIVQHITFSSTLPWLGSGTMYNYMIVPHEYGQGYVATTYEFNMMMQHNIPSDGRFSITFPSSFSISSSDPQPTCTFWYSVPDVETPCIISGNQLTFYSFGFVGAFKFIVAKVIGVKNPAVSSISGFQFITYNSAGRVIDQYTVSDIIYLQSAWTPEIISYVDIENSPTNANATAVYTFTFSPSYKLWAGGLIQIDFPLANFGVLPEKPICRMRGEIIYYETCKGYGSSILVTMSQDALAYQIILSITGIRNFFQSKSDPFTIKTIYDGVVLQTTDSSVTESVLVNTTSQAPTLKVNEINFYPQNEGEIATYTFVFTPNIDISADAEIRITFPEEYDKRLGDSFKCYSTGLNGVLSCANSHSYVISITGFEYFPSCLTCQISLSIYGIINPNYHSSTQTGEFWIGIITGDSYQELNEYSGKLTLSAAPGYNDVVHTTTLYPYARFVSYYTFNMTTSNYIPTTENGGAIWVRYPKDYDLSEASVHCRSSSYWALGVPDCNLYYDVMIANAQTTKYSGFLMLYHDDVPNPNFSGLARQITVETFDGGNSIIVDRSYPNLNPSRFNFYYNGPLIIVNNNNDFQVTSGTMSTFIPVSFNYPAALNLTLIPSCDGFSFIPGRIDVQIGEIYKTFRISVPPSMTEGRYSIKWTTNGEITPPYYTPLLQTYFNVTSSPLANISIEDIVPIPVGGTSLPVLVQLSNAPDTDLTVNLDLYESNGVSISTDSLTFTDGEILSNFTVSVSGGVIAPYGYISISVNGTNKDSFYLQKTTLQTSVYAQSGSSLIYNAILLSTNRTSASVFVMANRICQLYYSWALRGTIPPTFDEVRKGGPAPYSTTQSGYGSARILSNLNVTITITGLTAQTFYSFYIYSEDLSGFANSDYTQLNFQTDVRYRAASVELDFDQSYLTTDDINKARGAVALLLSLNSDRVVEKEDSVKTDPNYPDSPSNHNRRLDTVISSSVTFYILDQPTSDNYGKPIYMTKLLASKKNQLSSMLTNLDLTQSIAGVEVYMEPCSFATTPSILSASTYNTIIINSELTVDGNIYAIAIPRTNDPGIPYSFQVYNGYNLNNRPEIAANVSVSANEHVNLTIGNLTAATNYSLYVICTNNYPVYPDILDDSYLISLNWTTADSPDKRSLNLTVSSASFIIASCFSILLI
ncbi:unnamed protein product [Blepharisma stoltei]|uniref:Uncharacterized protein n=1 Tax=Blepharisma stoltei TaxID=1481888 RepID=A0AAU9JE30_9CILI|nr:unnamed protein product [Blepharisma stoltei]